MKIKEEDKTFPGFKNAFDIVAVKNVIGESFKKIRKDIVVENCEISDVKYEPGNQCIILYRTMLKDNYFKKSWEQLFLGKVLKRNEDDLTFPKEAIYSKEMGMIFTPFPHDPSIPWLPETYCSEAMKEKLLYLFPWKRWRLKNVEIKLLAYAPQMRATFLYTILAKDKQSGENTKFEWVAKTNVFKTSHRVFSNYWVLWKASAGKILMPKPTGFLISPQMTFQEKIEGIRLGAIVDAPNINQIMEDTAKSIAHFHNLKIPLSNTRKLQQEVRTLNRWSDVLINLRPDLKLKMEALRKNIISELEIRMNIEAPIHADFHHTNILVDDKLVQIIDMDEMAFGDPCLDVGRFLSSLRIPSLRTYGSFDGLKPQRELFIETYLKSSARDVRNIHLFESASLFTSAASAFRLQRKNWESEVPMLLDESENAFMEAKKGKPLSQHHVNRKHQVLPKNDHLYWAKDEVYLQTLLAPHFFKKYNQVLVGCEYKGCNETKGYDCFEYLTSSWEGKLKVKAKIEVFIHKNRERRFIYDYVNFLNKKMGDTEDGPLFPQPIAHLPELGALVFYRPIGNSLTTLFGSDQALSVAEKLAKGFASLHRIDVELDDCNMKTMRCSQSAEKASANHGSESEFLLKVDNLIGVIQDRKKNIKPKTSYVLKDLSPHNTKLFNDDLQITFPVRKNVAHPYTDIGNYTAKVILYGLQENKMDECEKFLNVFSKTYLTAAKTSEPDLAVFTAEALVDEAGKLLGKKEFENISTLLLKKAENTLD